MMFQDKTFCQEISCSFFKTCERAWTRELQEEANEYERIEVWFFSGRPVCFNKGWDFIFKGKGEENEPKGK